jgi:hypothetical protein
MSLPKKKRKEKETGEILIEKRSRYPMAKVPRKMGRRIRIDETEEVVNEGHVLLWWLCNVFGQGRRAWKGVFGVWYLFKLFGCFFEAAQVLFIPIYIEANQSKKRPSDRAS